MTGNAIVHNLFAQVDAEGNHHGLFDEIVDHRTDGTEIKQQNAFLTTRTGNRCRHETTKGWEILVQLKDQSTMWFALKYIKNSFPVHLAEYSVRMRISQEPAFAWWVSFVIKKQNIIISKVKSKYWMHSHKFGICVPVLFVESFILGDRLGHTNAKLVGVHPILGLDL